MSSSDVPVSIGERGVTVPRPLIDYDFQTVVAAPPKQRLILRAMVALIVALIVWLALARVDIVINADGKLVTSDSIIVMQPFETSIVQSIRVTVGQKVNKGDILATLDPTFTRADESDLTAKFSSLEALYDRLTAENEGSVYAPTTPNPDELTQIDVWRKRQDEYAARVNSADRKVQELKADIEAHKTEAGGLSADIDLSTQANNIYQTLVENSLASKLKLIETTENLVNAKTRLSNNSGEQQKLEEQVAQTEADRQAFISEWRTKIAEDLAKTRSDRDAAAAQLSKAQMRHQLAVLRAPSDATVLEIADRPKGSVVREAEPLLRLVPADARIDAEIRIDTRDVARLHNGDPVTVKFEALPWQQFGLAHGVLKSLTPDTIDDENPREAAEAINAPELKQSARPSTIHYRARIELTDLSFRNLPPDFALRPGMRVLADVKLGRRSVLEYILNPVTRVLTDSLREP